MLGLGDLCSGARGGPRIMIQLAKCVQADGNGEQYKLRLLSREIRDAVDIYLFRRLRIRSTSSSMLGISSILEKNPRLCKLVLGIEYHLTPNAATPDTGVEAYELPSHRYRGDYGDFSGAMDFIRRFHDNGDVSELNDDIGTILDQIGQRQSKAFDYEDMLQCEKGSPGESNALILENFRFSENTFYDGGLDFRYLAQRVLGSDHFPNLRTLKISSWDDEGVHQYWQWYPEKAIHPEGTPGGEDRAVFKWPEPGYCPRYLYGPAKRAFYVIIYGLYLRNQLRPRPARVISLTFDWLPNGLDSEPNYWRLWAPVALTKIVYFSCPNISNQISKTWMFGLFRPYVLYPMSETVRILKIGYSRWSFAEPVPGYVTTDNNFNRKRRGSSDDQDGSGKSKRLSTVRGGDTTDNVLPLLSLLKPLSQGEAEDYLQGGAELVAHLEDITEGLENEKVLSAYPRPAFPELLELHLKLWQEIDCVENFAPFFDRQNQSFNYLQRLHLEGFHLSRQFLWADSLRCADAEERPLELGLEQVIEKDGRDGFIRYNKSPWTQLIEKIENRPRKRSRYSDKRGKCKVTHDNLWEDTLVLLPGGDPHNARHQHIVPWGRCWSWAVDQEKAAHYIERLETNMPWVRVDKAMKDFTPSRRSSSSISLPSLSSDDSPVFSPVSIVSSDGSFKASSGSSSRRGSSQSSSQLVSTVSSYPLIETLERDPQSDENVVKRGKGFVVDRNSIQSTHPTIENVTESITGRNVNRGTAEFIERDSIHSVHGVFGDARDSFISSSSAASSSSRVSNHQSSGRRKSSNADSAEGVRGSLGSIIATIDESPLEPTELPQEPNQRSKLSSTPRRLNTQKPKVGEDHLAWWER